jgi:hypothetical protein
MSASLAARGKCRCRTRRGAQCSLFAPEPGRGIWDLMRSPDEVVARAGASFMYHISAIVGGYEGFYLFHAFNNLAALKYEGIDASSRLILANLQNGATAAEFLLKLSEPVRLSKSRWMRKLLQLAFGSGMSCCSYVEFQRVHGADRSSAVQNVPDRADHRSRH